MIVHPWMLPPAEQSHITEAYVSSPPALTITDERGDIWCLGFSKGEAPNGEYAFMVLHNGMPTGEYASRIERRAGKIRIFTHNGWKRWSGHSFF